MLPIKDRRGGGNSKSWQCCEGIFPILSKVHVHENAMVLSVSCIRFHLFIDFSSDVADNWTYSSDEDVTESTNDSAYIPRATPVPSSTPSTSVQSIIQMMSNKKGDGKVDTNLLSKVAGVINMPPITSGKSLLSLFVIS